MLALTRRRRERPIERLSQPVHCFGTNPLRGRRVSFVQKAAQKWSDKVRGHQGNHGPDNQTEYQPWRKMYDIHAAFDSQQAAMRGSYDRP